jgi:hypothetical protein
MRQFITKYGVFVAAGLIVLAAIITFATRRGGPPSVPTRAYYIDDLTGEESIQSATAIPPLDNKDGKPNLVQVVKISCDGGRNPQVAYYRKYHPKAKQIIEQYQNDPNHIDEVERARSEGELVRLPQAGSPWVKAMSEEGEKVISSIQCPAGKIRQAVYP